MKNGSYIINKNVMWGEYIDRMVIFGIRFRGTQLTINAYIPRQNQRNDNITRSRLQSLNRRAKKKKPGRFETCW